MTHHAAHRCGDVLTEADLAKLGDAAPDKGVEVLEAMEDRTYEWAGSARKRPLVEARICVTKDPPGNNLRKRHSTRSGGTRRSMLSTGGAYPSS
jgi:hypothetical protein